MPYLIDPRSGDSEDDASSTKMRPMLAIAGSMVAELSPAKFLLTWTLVVAIPALTVGLIVPATIAFVSKVSYKTLAISGIGSALFVCLLVAIAWYGLRPLVRLAESNFWALNSIAVQPCYALVREGLRHIAENVFLSKAAEAARARARANISLLAGVLCAAAGCVVMALVWPHTRWTAGFDDFMTPIQWIIPAVANATMAVTLYFSVASIAWALSDALMDQPERLAEFDSPGPDDRTFRVVHLSDLHIVGEPYGFRIESGRAGACGNERVRELFEELLRIDAAQHIDLILMTGDMTDAGRSGEWAAFFDLLEQYPSLLDRTLILPGNHDVNIVDRANPARLELPMSPQKRLRQLRMLSAMDRVQGERVHVFDRTLRKTGATLSQALQPHRDSIVAFADRSSFFGAYKLESLWADSFPLVLPPREPDGLGVILLNSNSDANFSFTNALGFLSVEDVAALSCIVRERPHARWIVGLHHHLVEYPMLAKSFSERIGTSLINGSWLVRQLKPIGDRLIILHGHRHIDWIGHCGPTKIISAPSPVMEALNHEPTSFLIHSIICAKDGPIGLATPRRVVLPGVGQPSNRESLASRANAAGAIA